MEFHEVVRRRRMVRNYQPDRQPDPEVVRDLIAIATRAPSAGFSQGWHFLVLDTRAALDGFWLATSDPEAEADSWLAGMRSAPVLIMTLSIRQNYLDRYAEPDKGWDDRDPERWPVPYWDVDTGMASMLLLLAAQEAGLAACFFGVPVERLELVRDAFDIPADVNIVGVVSLGYGVPDTRSPSLKRGRKPVSEVASWGKYGRPTSN